jgi:hypothetical protein
VHEIGQQAWPTCQIPVTIEKAFVAILIRVFRVQPPRLQITIIRESIHFESYVRE